MKKITKTAAILAILSAFAFISHGQRQVDLSLEAIVSPANNLVIANGASSPISFTLKNNGSDSLFAGDTIVIIGTLTGNAATAPGGLMLTNASPHYAPGVAFTVQLQQPSLVNNRTANTDTTIELCLKVAAIRQISEFGTWTDPDTTNNELCVSVTLKGASTNSIAGIAHSVATIESFPNPTHCVVNLKVDLNAEGNVSANVYDMTGKVVKTVVFQNQTRGEKNYALDLKELNAGLYFIQLESAKGRYISNKILLQ